MQLVLYQQLSQFLIALAVGTLAGDALLHLLPHAFMSVLSAGKEHQHHSHGDHDKLTWLGLVSVLSLLGFFLFERVVILFSEWRRERLEQGLEGKKSPLHKVKVVRK